jgi:hypothetical protein
MRVLILIPEFGADGGGISTFYRNLTVALSAQGAKVRVVEGSANHAETEPNRRSTEDGICVETLEVDRLRRWHRKFSAYAAAPGLRGHLAAAWAMWEQAGFGEDSDIVEASDWGLLFVPPSIGLWSCSATAALVKYRLMTRCWVKRRKVFLCD